MYNFDNMTDLEVGQKLQQLFTSNAKPPKAKDRIVYTHPYEFKMTPRTHRVKPLTIVKALDPIAARDDLRAALCHIHYGDGEYCATDAHKLVVIKQPGILTNQFTETKWVQKYLQKMDQKGWDSLENFSYWHKKDFLYPDYKAVIPAKVPSPKVKVSELLNLAYACVQAQKFFYNAIGLLIYLNDVPVNHRVLYPVLKCFAQLGVEEVELQTNGLNRAVAFWSEEVTGLCMPVFSKVYKSHPAPFVNFKF